MAFRQSALFHLEGAAVLHPLASLGPLVAMSLDRGPLHKISLPGATTTQLPKADLLTFWCSSFGTCLVTAPKG